MGKLTIAREWREGVTYSGEVVTHDGGCWQAIKDTGSVPGGRDWIALALSGRDGQDAVVPRVCGTYKSGDIYQYLDIVTKDSSSFVAKCDNPGLCPGPNWQLVACGGKRGLTGERGPAGPPGPVAEVPRIVEWKIDRAKYVVTPTLSDGTDGPSIEIAGLFEQFQLETR